MAGITSDFESSPHGRPWPTGHWVLLILCLAVLVVLPGCRGCRRSADQREAEQKRQEAEKEKEEEEEEKKPDLEIGRLLSQPHGSKPRGCPYKPGHWTATTLPARANNFDIVGDLEMTVVDAAQGSPRRGKPMELVATPYTSTGSRVIALPKGRLKLFDSVLYVPAAGRNASALGRITARGGGRGAEKPHTLDRMPSYQYHCVVLARFPSNYKYLETLDAVRNPRELSSADLGWGFYRIQLVQAEKQTTLPLYALFWTSIACIVWDDAEPDALLLKQQTALLDWLHWGGQLIISGPGSLDGLRNSFLAPYLPATSAGTRKLTAADLEELSDWWTKDWSPKLARKNDRRPLVPVEPWTGVTLSIEDPDVQAVPGTGGLLVERRVGRGRIVVSAFDLNERELITWPGFDSFFNGCLLRRPPREFYELEGTLEDQVAWYDYAADQRRPGGPFDPHGASKQRYFSRDTGAQALVPPQPVDDPFASGYPISEIDPAQFGGHYGPGVGAWNDFSAVASAARESLLNAARIEIPDRMFVVWVVSLYVLVLVPANCMFFRWLGRVEWAWVAAPLIALVCTVVVIRLAQLDIGFARSQTEISLVEMQGDYPRAHVTRYTALYTALSTTYGIRFDDRGAQVQPFPRKTPTSPSDFERGPGERLRTLQYRYGNDVSMRGFYVQSNTTGLVHSEQMVDVGGPISLAETLGGGYEVVNQTAFPLYGAGVIRKNARGQIETAWIGTLEPGAAADLEFSRSWDAEAAGSFWTDQRNRAALTARNAPPDQLNLCQLVELAEDPREVIVEGGRQVVRTPAPQSGYGYRIAVSGPPRLHRLGLRPGDVRLVAWLDQRIPGLEIKPAAPQSRHAALVVAHLRYGHGQDPQPDFTTLRELKGRDGRRVFETF